MSNGVVDEGFIQRYRALLDAEQVALDFLEHSQEVGDRVNSEIDFELWRRAAERRAALLNELEPLPAAM
jgi:hypothetical protein